MDGNERVSFDIKELLTELRADVRAIDHKLELKADRERVHLIANDLAAIRLEWAPRGEAIRMAQLALTEHDTRLAAVESWRYRLMGAAAASGLFLGFLLSLVLYVVTHG